MQIDRHYSKSESAEVAQVGDEMVALDINKGVCFGLNPIATRIWELLETTHKAQDISEVLIKEYEVTKEQCDADVLALLEDLRAAGLVS